MGIKRQEKKSSKKFVAKSKKRKNDARKLVIE